MVLIFRAGSEPVFLACASETIHASQMSALGGRSLPRVGRHPNYLETLQVSLHLTGSVLNTVTSAGIGTLDK